MPCEQFLIEKAGIRKLKISPIKLNLHSNTFKIHYHLIEGIFGNRNGEFYFLLNDQES